MNIFVFQRMSFLLAFCIYSQAASTRLRNLFLRLLFVISRLVLVHEACAGRGIDAHGARLAPVAQQGQME